MKEELSINEEVVRDKQTASVINSVGRPENIRRRYVSAGWLIFILLLPLATLCLWMLRLLGVIGLPFEL